MKTRISLPTALFPVVLFLFAGGCVYDVPITPTATRKVDERLIGNWSATSGSDKMRIRKYDDSTYVLTYNGDLYRAYASDIGKTPWVSVQDLNSDERKYQYVNYSLDNGKLTLRTVNEDVIPKDIKTSQAVQELLRKNLDHPDLYQKESTTFTKD